MNSLAISLSVALFAQGDAETLRTIRAAVREQFTSIASVELRFHFDEPNARQWEWVVQGERFLLVGGPWRRPNAVEGEKESLYRLSFDGKFCYHTDYDPREPTKVRSIHRLTAIPAYYYANAAPALCLGWVLLSSDDTLLGLLEKPAAKVIGKESIDGQECWKVELGVCTFRGTPTNELVAWFDPSVSYLPRKLSFRPARIKGAEAITLRDGEYYIDYRATEYRQLDDPVFGAKRWFPVRYELESVQNLSLVLEDVKINHSISPERFIPDMPFGMLIYDKVGTADQTTSFVGGEAAAADRRKELIAKSGELSGPLIDARAEGGGLSLRSLLVIFGLLLLLFGAAWVFWRRHGARSSH